jgi:hypothetical protein
MARQPSSPKPSKISLDRARAATAQLRTLTAGLRAHVGGIKATCVEQTVPEVFDKWRTRFAQMGSALQYNQPPDALLAEPHRATRLTNLGKAKCRMKAREARVEAEPEILAARGAAKAHRGARKEELVAEKEARAAAKRRGEDNKKGKAAASYDKQLAEGIQGLEAVDNTAPMVPLFQKLAPGFWAEIQANPKLKNADGKPRTLIDLFAAYADSHQEEIAAILADSVPTDSQLAAAQAAHHAKQGPGSGPRSSRRGGPRSSRHGGASAHA